jgi:NAD(P)-dependent dehydrogenase (short-subunit alcohol dehydrogenase family)
MEFKDKVAVITGSASGIGWSLAKALAEQGSHVVMADINEIDISGLKAEINDEEIRLLAVECDVSRDDHMEALARRTFSEMGRVDILINNAGVMLRGFADKIPMEDWEWILGVNLFGVIRGVRAFLPHMIERGEGYIVNTSSMGGLIGGQSHSIGYSTSKFAVTGFTEVLYKYLRPKGIGVSLLCPGAVATNINKTIRFTGDDDPMDLGADQRLEMGQPNVLHPDDVAWMVIDAMAQNQFLILTDPTRFQQVLLKRAENVQRFMDLQIAAVGRRKP